MFAPTHYPWSAYPKQISIGSSLRCVTLSLRCLTLPLRCVPSVSLIMLSTILLTAQFTFAFAPQNTDLPDYNAAFAQGNRQGNPSSQPSNEVRVDPFVKPAAASSSVIGSNSPVLPSRSNGSASTAPSQSPTNQATMPGNFQPSSEVTASTNSPLSLKPRSSASANENTNAPEKRANSFQSVLTMFTSLLVVLALFFGFMIMLKKANGGTTPDLPKDVFQVLGTSRVAGRHPLFLLRLGHKLVLVHAGSGEVQTITEVTDPAEVDRLCGSCEENQPNSLTQSFKQVLKNVTDGGSGKSKSYTDNLRFRSKTKSDEDEVSPAMALLAKEKP